MSMKIENGLNLAGTQINNLANGVAATDAASLGQVQQLITAYSFYNIPADGNLYTIPVNGMGSSRWHSTIAGHLVVSGILVTTAGAV